MAIKLHRCPLTFIKSDGHACWRVQQALDEMNIEYEVAKAPLIPPLRRSLQELSGQKRLPTIEYEDGSVYREESVDMATRIRAGELGTSGSRPGA